MIISTELKIISERICSCIIRLDSLSIFIGIRLKLKIIFDNIININRSFNPPNNDPRRLFNNPKYTNFISFVNPFAIKIIAEYDSRKIKIKTTIFKMSKFMFINSTMYFETISVSYTHLTLPTKA